MFFSVFCNMYMYTGCVGAAGVFFLKKCFIDNFVAAGKCRKHRTGPGGGLCLEGCCDKILMIACLYKKEFLYLGNSFLGMKNTT